MNIDKVKELGEGLEFKNYPTLCRVLDEPVKRGTSIKNKQLKEWSRYFSWVITENKSWIITEVFEEVGEKVRDKRVSLSVEPIKALLLGLFLKNENHELGTEVYYSRKQLLQKLNMVNHNYIDCEGLKHDLALFLGTSGETVDNYYSDTKSALETRLGTALKGLQSVDAELTKIVVEELKHWNCDKLEKYICSRKMNTEEKTLLLEIKRSLLKKLKLTNENQLYGSTKVGFYNECQRLMKEVYPNLKFFYTGYECVYSKDSVEEELLAMGTKDFESEMTKFIIEELKEGIERRYTTAINTPNENKSKAQKNLVDGTHKEDSLKLVNLMTLPNVPAIKEMVLEDKRKRKEEVQKRLELLNLFS